MAGKFASQFGAQARQGSSPITSTDTVVTNHGGAAALTRDAKSDLFLLGVMNFVSEDTYYESAQTRDNRFLSLVHTVTEQDAGWVARFIPWLRNEANMRSAAVVAAVEYGRAGGENRRAVLASACSRADEPAEVLAYWIGNYGRPIPSWVKRGVGDAARRLYNEKSLAKYDSVRSQFRFADVINLAHVQPRDEHQSLLFKYALESRYNSNASTDGLDRLGVIQQVNKGNITRDQLLSDPDLIRKGGVTWESLSGLGQMDAAAWEAVIPSMGYMALLRNLRNFEQAGISTAATKLVTDKLADPEEVAKSRQLPFRFWSAYKNVNGLQWAYPIEQALNHSVRNIPALGGRTLVLMDTSGSMQSAMSGKSTISRQEAGTLFAAALALRGETVDFFGFADYTYKLPIAKGGSVLKIIQEVVRRNGEAGVGTNIPGAMGQWNGHDRVVLFTDMQTLGRYDRNRLHDDYRSSYSRRYSAQRVDIRNSSIPAHVPVFGFNLAGYATTQIGGNANEFELGGLTDKTFELLPLLERGGKGQYPF